MTDHTPTPDEQAWTDAKLDPNPASQPPAPDPKRPRRWPWVAGIVAALLVGISIGGVGGDTTPAAVETVEVEVPGETVEVTVVPDACMDIYHQSDALDDQYRLMMSRIAEMPFSEAMDGILAFDPGPIENLTEWFIDMTAWINEDWGAERDRLWMAVMSAADACEADA